MKNSLYLKLIVIASISMSIFSCKKDAGSHEPLSSDGTIPKQVTNITVKNEKGAALLTYTVPVDPSLSYVKAVYTLKTGEIKEVKASYYVNELRLDGFADTTAQEIKVYSVNRAEKMSEPVLTTVTPLRNPIWDVYYSLKISPDFSGIKIFALNQTNASISIQLLTQQNGGWGLYSGIYTKVDSINSTIRGFDTTAIKVGICVRDRFLNTTDTLFTTISPLYEVMFNRNTFKGVNLPGEPTYDFYNANSRGITALWDGIIRGDAWPNIVWTNASSTDVQHVTFDIGKSSKLSRMVIYEYSENGSPLRNYYFGGNLRFFEVWASNNPAPDGSFDGWDRLGSYEIKKPSGLPYGVISQDDFNTAAAGYSCTFDSGEKRYRYIRINSLQNWIGTTYMTLVETQVYGDPR